MVVVVFSHLSASERGVDRSSHSSCFRSGGHRRKRCDRIYDAHIGPMNASSRTLEESHKLRNRCRKATVHEKAEANFLKRQRWDAWPPLLLDSLPVYHPNGPINLQPAQSPAYIVINLNRPATIVYSRRRSLSIRSRNGNRLAICRMNEH